MLSKSSSDTVKTSIGDIPLWVKLMIILYFLVIGFLGLWANDVAVNTQGPNIIKPGPDGGAYLQIGSRLFLVSQDGAITTSHDLSELGIEKVFDLHFTRDNAVMVRVGPFNRGVVNNIATYLRLPNSVPPKPADAESGIFRCRLDLKACEPFSVFDPGDVYWMDMDADTGNAYIADTTRHQLHMLDTSGTLVATNKDEFLFPNQVQVLPGGLLVVDTNHKRIKLVSKKRENFGVVIDTHDPVTDSMKKARHSWPYMTIRSGDENWAIIMGPGMGHGGVYRYSDSWRYLGRLELPADADPSYLARIGGEVWVSDFENNRVYRFDSGGEFLGYLASAALEKIFEKNRERRTEYSTITIYFAWIFVVSVVLGVFAGFWLEWKRGRALALAPAGPETVTIDATDPEIYWLKRSATLKRFVFLMTAVVVLLMSTVGVSMVSFQAATTGKTAWSPLLTPVGIIVIIVIFIMYYLMNQRIGVRGDLVVLKRGGKIKAARANNVFYSGNIIAIDGMFNALGSDTYRLYRMDEIVKHLHPVIAEANVFERRDMGAYQFYHQVRKVLEVDYSIYLFWLAVIFSLLLDEVLPSSLTETTAYFIGNKVLLNGMIALWIFRDATRKHIDESVRGMYVAGSIFLTEIVVPVYLVKTRGWRGTFKSVLTFFGYLVAALLVYLIAEMILIKTGA